MKGAKPILVLQGIFEKEGERKNFYHEEEYNSGDIFFITINKKHF